MPKATIRRAVPTDAEVLASLGARTFAIAFGHLYPPADLATFLHEAHTPTATGAELADASKAAWLAETDDVAVGYALAGPCALPHPEVTERSGELKRIYVLDDAQGEGLGQRLMDAALAWLAAEGRAPIWLGVFSENLGAQRFYERQGFRKVGEYGFRVGAATDREFIFRRD
jgi:ribosomal protein S18 acetylase RimI-like enzyme